MAMTGTATIRVGRRTWQVHFGRVAATVLAGVLFGIGMAAAAAAITVVWVAAAVKVGWSETWGRFRGTA